MILWIVLGYVVVARVIELIIAQRNTQALIAGGAVEQSARHYPLIVAVHVGWLISLALLGPGQPVTPFWLWVFIALQPLRVWVMATLGARWTTRIIVVPGETLVRRGPYRWFSHPNYMVVVGELASLPLAFGLWGVALGFSLANAVALTIRIRAEEAALHPAAWQKSG